MTESTETQTSPPSPTRTDVRADTEKSAAQTAFGSPDASQIKGDSGDTEFKIGTWHGYDNYGCPHCPFATLEGPEAVMFHIHTSHPEGQK